MKLPLTNWKKTLRTLGFRVDWDAVGKQRARKQFARQRNDEGQLFVETLEQRQMLSVSLPDAPDDDSSALRGPIVVTPGAPMASSSAPSRPGGPGGLPTNLAEIRVVEGSSTLANGTSQVSFGTTNSGVPVEKTFTIYNDGTANLELTTSSLSLPSGFTVTTLFASQVAPGGSTDFVLRLDAAASGYFEGDVSFSTNDVDDAVFEFSVSGNVEIFAPDIEIIDEQSQLVAHQTGELDLGVTQLDTNKDVVITVRNAGAETLELDQSLIVVPSHVELVSLSSSSIAPGGGTATLTLRLLANEIGSFSGTVEIPSNDPDESPYQFTANGQVTDNSFAFTEQVRLLNDTGTSSSDRVTYDPTLTGQVVGEFVGDIIEVEFDHDGDGISDGRVQVFMPGQEFEYDPRQSDPVFDNVLGAKTITYRVVQRNHDGSIVDTSSWQNFELTLEEDHSIGDLAVKFLDVVFPVSSQTSTVYNPTVGGLLDGIIGSGYVKIEFDHDGDQSPDGNLIVNEDNTFFLYDPRESDPTINDLVGTISLGFRIIKYDYQDVAIATGSWGTFTYEKLAPPTSLLALSSLAIENTNAAEQTSSPVATGQVLHTSGLSNVRVEFDITGDTTRNFTQPLFEETSFQKHLGLGQGAYTLRSRVLAWNDAYGIDVSSSWEEVSFEVIPGSGATIETIELANDTGDVEGVTLDPSIIGNLDPETEDPSGYFVELDRDGDGVADQNAWVNDDGEFSFFPAIDAFGPQSYQFRTVTANGQAGSVTYGPWKSFEFELENIELPTISTIELANDDGDSDTDLITSDTRIKGVVDGTNVAFQQVEFDFDQDGDIDATSVTDIFGRFHVQVTGLTGGSVTVQARLSGWNGYVFQSQYGPWSGLTFEYQPNALPESAIQDVSLKWDTGIDSNQPTTYNPVIVGSLHGERLAYQTIEIDENSDGIVEHSIETDETGQFEFHFTNAVLGPEEIRFRLKQWNYGTQSFVNGEWVDFDFHYVTRAIPIPQLVSLGLFADTGVSQTDEVTGNASISGTIDGQSEHYILQLDYDNDGTPDEVAPVAADFVYRPNLVESGQNDIAFRVIDWDSVSSQYVTSSWSSLQFQWVDESNTASMLTDLQLLHETGGHTTNPLIQGRVIDHLDQTNAVVQVDVDNDGNVDQTINVDADGSFEFDASSLPLGSTNLAFRTLRSEFAAGASLVSGWSTLAYVYDQPAVRTVAAPTVALVADTGLEGDGITEDRRLSGSVMLTEESSEFVYAQYDINADDIPDGSVLVDSSGAFLVDSELIEPGAHTIRFRVQDFLENNDAIYSDWTSFSFELVSPPSEIPSFQQLALASDTGTSGDNVTADATITGQVSSYSSDLVILVDYNNDQYADLTVQPNQDGTFTVTPTLNLGFHSLSFSVQMRDEYGLDTNGDWQFVHFVLSDEPDGAAAQSLYSTMSSIIADWETTQASHESALKALEEELRNATQIQEADFDAQIVAAQHVRDLKHKQAEAEYKATQKQLIAERQARLDAIAPGANALTSYQRSGYPSEEGTATFDPAIENPYRTPAGADTLEPSIQRPNLEGEEYKLDADTEYQNNIAVINSEFEQQLIFAQAEMLHARHVADEAFRGTVRQVLEQYRQAAEEARQVYETATPDSEVDISAAEQKRSEIVKAANREYEAKLEKLNQDEAAAIQQAQEDADLENIRQDAYAAYFTTVMSAYHNYQATGLAMLWPVEPPGSFPGYPGEYHYRATDRSNNAILPLVSIFNQALETRENLVAPVEQALASQLSDITRDFTHRRQKLIRARDGKIIAANQEYSESLAAYRRDIANDMLQHLLTYRTTLAQLTVSRAESIADARKVRNDAYADAQYNLDFTTSEATATKWLSETREARDAILRWHNATNSSWTAYQLEIAEHELTFVTGASAKYREVGQLLAAGKRTETKARATATQTMEKEVADAKGDRTIALATALYDFQAGEVTKHYERRIQEASLRFDFDTERVRSVTQYYMDLATATHVMNVGNSQAWRDYRFDLMESSQAYALSSDLAQYTIDVAADMKVYTDKRDWNQYQHRLDVIDAKETYHDDFLAADATYQNGKYEAERVWVAAVSDLYTTYETDVAKADHGDGVSSDGLQIRLVAAFVQQSKDNADAAKTRAHNSEQAQKAYADRESELAVVRGKADVDSWKGFQDAASNSYYALMLDWFAASNQGPWEIYYRDLALSVKTMELAGHQDHVDYVKASLDAEHVYNLAVNLAEFEAAQEFQTAQNTHVHGIVDASLSYTQLVNQGHFQKEEDRANNTTTFDKEVVRINKVHETQKVDLEKTRLEANYDAQWKYDREVAYQDYLLAIEMITPAQRNTNVATAAQTKKEEIAVAEVAFAVGTATNDQTRIRDFEAEHVRFTEENKTLEERYATTNYNANIVLAQERGDADIQFAFEEATGVANYTKKAQIAEDDNRSTEKQLELDLSSDNSLEDLRNQARRDNVAAVLSHAVHAAHAEALADQLDDNNLQNPITVFQQKAAEADARYTERRIVDIQTYGDEIIANHQLDAAAVVATLTDRLDQLKPVNQAYTNAQMAAEVTYADQAAQADAALTLDLVHADSAFKRDTVTHEQAYLVDLAKGRQKRNNQIATDWVSYVSQAAQLKANNYLGTLSDNDYHDQRAQKLEAFENAKQAAIRVYVQDVGAALVKRATGLGDILVTRAEEEGQAHIEFLQAKKEYQETYQTSQKQATTAAHTGRVAVWTAERTSASTGDTASLTRNNTTQRADLVRINEDEIIRATEKAEAEADYFIEVAKSKEAYYDPDDPDDPDAIKLAQVKAHVKYFETMRQDLIDLRVNQITAETDASVDSFDADVAENVTLNSSQYTQDLDNVAVEGALTVGEATAVEDYDIKAETREHTQAAKFAVATKDRLRDYALAAKAEAIALANIEAAYLLDVFDNPADETLAEGKGSGYCAG